MMNQPVEQPSQPRQRTIFSHRQARRVDINAARSPIQIVPSGVVTGVLPSPMRIWRQRDNAADHAEQVVGTAGLEERPVPAIVLDHEDAYNKAGCQDRQAQCHPV
jgi:hypothetical protein